MAKKKTKAAKANAKTAAKPKNEAKKTSAKTNSMPKQTEAQGARQKTAQSSEAKRKTAPKRSNANAKQTNAGEARQPLDFAQMIVNQMLEAQRIWLEITTQQTALVVKTVSDVMNLSNNAPSKALSNLARASVQGFIEAQRQ